MRTRRELLAGLAATLPASAVLAKGLPSARGLVAHPAACHRGGARLGPLRAAMANGRFIAYHPTAISFWYGKPTRASAASIEADLRTLRPWFDGLITYSALNGAEHVADVAARLGFRALIQGVWDPFDRREVANALSAHARHPDLVVGLGVGNELVLSRRGTWGDAAYALHRLRRQAHGLPLATTEPFNQFLDDPDALSTLAAMDFMLVNVHPIFQDWFRRAQPFNWAQFVVRVGDLLAKRFCGPILVKETGVPTGPASVGYTAEMQRAFYRELEKQMKPNASRAFAYFSAFDLPWHAYDASPMPGDHHPEEAYWGFFTEARKPKAIVSDLARLPAKRF